MSGRAYTGNNINCADHDKHYKNSNLGSHPHLKEEKLARANPVKTMRNDVCYCCVLLMKENQMLSVYRILSMVHVQNTKKDSI